MLLNQIFLFKDIIEILDLAVNSVSNSNQSPVQFRVKWEHRVLPSPSPAKPESTDKYWVVSSPRPQLKYIKVNLDIH